MIFITTYVLIMPAVTLSRAADCGQEEHTHTEDCYETETELTCGQEEHTHTEDCYDEEGNLICGMEEHVHDDSCYTSREVLVCGQEEHVHTEDCYAEEEAVQEDIPEEAEEEEQPQAGDTVMEPAGPAAPEQLSQIRFREYLTDWTTLYYAPEDGDNWQPLAEDKWHSLYEDNWGIRRSDTADRGLDPEEYVLLHIGYRIPVGRINATNPEAEFILPLSVRMTEEEVRDNNNNNNTLFRGTDREADELFVDGEYEIKEERNNDGEVTQRKLVITFNEDACLRCGGEKLTDGTETLAAEELEGFFELRVKAEDLLTLEKKSESVYVLEWNDEEDLDTIIRFDPEKLAAYYGEKNTEDTEAEPEAEGTASGELRVEGEDYTITVSYTEEASLPADVSLKVKEITRKKEYEIYKAQMEEELIDSESTKVTGARFFDNTLEDSEGNELHPESGVRVLIETKDTLQENEKVQICHFDEEKDKPVEVESREVTGETYEEENLGVEFEAESFSVYGVVYTVDFHYEINGKMYEFSIPGGGFVSLEHVVEVLGIATADENSENGAENAENDPENADDFVGEVPGVDVSDENSTAYEEAIKLNEVEISEATKKFVADVVSVEFSNPELVWAGKVDSVVTVGGLKEANGLEVEYSAELTTEQIEEINSTVVELGDWALISMRAFDTEETLEVTMKNGESFSIRVTDAQIRKTVIDARGNAWEIAVTYGEEALIPDGAELRVSEILPEDEEYSSYYQKAAELVCTDENVPHHGYGRIFDISIFDGAQEVEPKSNVQVSIKLADVPEDCSDLRVVHFGENMPEMMTTGSEQDFESTSAVSEEDGGSVAELCFETDSFSLYAVISMNTNNGNGLGGQKFAIINRNVNEAVLGQTNNSGRIAAASISTQSIDGTNYVIADEVTLWEFESVNENVYNLKAPDGRYINITGLGTATLSNIPQNITVTANGDGLRLAGPNNLALNAWNNSVADGFGGGNYYNNGERFTLYSVNELIQNRADKISLTDLVNLHNGETPVDEVVIYTRILNQNRDGYDYYAVGADGSLIKVYDIGDTIGWVSSEATPEYLKWKLTVHSNEGNPNGYFDFQSMDNDLYLIPTEATGLKPDDPDDSWDLGVNMQGWNNGTYGSAIERWDSENRVYVGYAYDAVNKKIVPTSDDSQKLEFLFAHVKQDTTPNQLHTVETLDGKTKGITIKMYDFDGTNLNPSWPPRSREMTNVMGSNSTGSTNVSGIGYANRGLVSETLTNGFPIATETHRSLNQLFNDAHYKSDASNIFVQQIYDETGYFSYDSSKNYAYLDQSNNKFILYRELAAPVMEANNWTPSGQKGNFFPFDSLQDLADQNKVFTNGITVKYDGDLQEMSPDNPQYGEKLYRIEEGSTNNYSSYFFGMTMEAEFYQGPGGKDERGNDIIYEFNGDDDMWLYIDDRLVLDIGGCHGAVSGTINFSTGVVKVNGARDQVNTTLRDIFYNAGKLPDGTNWTEEGAAKWFKGNTFADYTKHSFKMFYMERGSYASNLKMKFNLLTIEPGTFVLEKKLPENVQAAYGDQLFAYQIYTVSGNQETLYTPPAGKYVTYEKNGARVLPEGQTESNGYKPEYSVNGQNYQNVYFLKAGESIVIPTENNEVRYYVKEIGIDPLYEKVYANGRELTIGSEGVSRVAQTSTDVVKTRGRVTYENVPKEVDKLRLEKIVQGPIGNPDDSFRFDVLLEDSATGRLVPYYMGQYYIVKTINGVDHYYKYENRQLVESNEQVAYVAGVNGSIDHILPGYTILITGLLPGTDFKVTENLSSSEFPEGYEYVKTEVENAGGNAESWAKGEGTILASNGKENSDALVKITNKREGITVERRILSGAGDTVFEDIAA